MAGYALLAIFGIFCVFFVKSENSYYSKEEVNKFI
jgi:hypothetical protein